MGSLLYRCIENKCKIVNIQIGRCNHNSGKSTDRYLRKSTIITDNKNTKVKIPSTKIDFFKAHYCNEWAAFYQPMVLLVPIGQPTGKVWLHR